MTVRVVIRRGPMARHGASVQHERADDLDGALVVLERELAEAPAAETVSFIGREFSPERQVVARGELRGRGVSGGVDVRGDGSREAFTGRWRRQVVEPRAGEDVLAALRRALGV